MTCGFELTNSLQLVKAWLSLARILLTEVTSMEYSIGNSEEPENFFATQVEEVSRSTLTRGRVELCNEQMANVQVLRESVARLGPKLRDILQTVSNDIFV
ncbi:unnamed protein product [Dibothriocephalus latus]|uniref:Uncharacterized protein n=1 Tax=Dibothriocephalus latus TaxID=60516 RepID=A0A3P7NZD6_DIBLA|nr:unnamed protein product [Dibothriocephalus latus]